MDAEMREMLSQLINRFDKMETRMGAIEEAAAQTNRRLDSIEGTVARINLQLEKEIGPAVRLLLENQMANKPKLDKLPPMEEKLDDVHSRVQVIEDVVTDHSKTIKAFKQAK